MDLISFLFFSCKIKCRSNRESNIVTKLKLKLRNLEIHTKKYASLDCTIQVYSALAPNEFRLGYYWFESNTVLSSTDSVCYLLLLHSRVLLNSGLILTTLLIVGCVLSLLSVLLLGLDGGLISSDTLLNVCKVTSCRLSALYT